MDTDRREQLVQHCTHCGGRILWALTVNSRWMPINAGAAENGNVQLTRDSQGLYAHVHGPAEAERRRALGRRLHLSHYATCTHRPAPRRRRRPNLPLRPASTIR